MIGIIIGYVVGALAADAEQFGIKDHFNWRRAIFLQGIALYIIAFCFAFFPNEKLDIMAEEKRLQTLAMGSQTANQITNENVSDMISVRSALSRNINPNR